MGERSVLNAPVVHRSQKVTNFMLALHRDEDKLHAYRAIQSSKNSIDIYSCAGNLIRRINVCLSLLDQPLP